MADHSDFFREARRRHVFRTGGLYIVGAWVVLQVADLAFASFGLPGTAMRFLWYAVLAGFPVALVLGWRYNFSLSGITRTPPSDDDSRGDLSLGTTDYLVLGAMGIIALGIAYRAIDEVRRTNTIEDAPSTTLIAENSIAVLPLDNLTGDIEQEYFSAGMHDTLITSLSKIRALRVTSRTSATRVDRSYSVPMIGQALGVANIIEGSVSREGNRIRIIVQLINAISDTHIWAQTYEREVANLFDLQNEIARDIAAAVQIRLSPEEERALAMDGVSRPETYDAYLRGMFQMHKESPEAYRNGIAILTEAVENDPSSALAYAGLAYAYGKLGHSPYPVDGAYPKSRQAALKAIELDDTLAEAHLAVGMYKLYYEWDWTEAETSLLRAIELNPSLVAAHYHYAWMLELFGDHAKALYHGEITKELDPLSPFYTGWLADQYRSAGLYDKAITEAAATLAFSPDYPVALFTLGMTYVEMGRMDDAIAVHEKLRDVPFWSFALASTLASAGKTEEANDLVAAIREVPFSAVPLVIVHGALRNDDQVFRWIAEAGKIRVPWYPWFITWFPQTRYLADDPRMQALAAELKLQL
jgi:TolB-like protein